MGGKDELRPILVEFGVMERLNDLLGKQGVQAAV